MLFTSLSLEPKSLLTRTELVFMFLDKRNMIKARRHFRVWRTKKGFVVSGVRLRLDFFQSCWKYLIIAFNADHDWQPGQLTHTQPKKVNANLNFMTQWNCEREQWRKKQKITFRWTRKPKNINRSSCRLPCWPFCHFSALFPRRLGITSIYVIMQLAALFCYSFAGVCKRWLKSAFSEQEKVMFSYFHDFLLRCLLLEPTKVVRVSFSLLFCCVLLHKIFVKWKISPTWAIERFNCIANETQWWCFVEIFRWFIDSFDVSDCEKMKSFIKKLRLNDGNLSLTLSSAEWLKLSSSFLLILINDNDIIHHPLACLTSSSCYVQPSLTTLDVC